ncbi:TonB family protein [Thermomonas sp. HDW16]|uniref:TonB family protein n=1 Tax=Thermomonas sp. HDW16 TaxID=2714945 RepID=UPI00140A0C76|nr:TonB family protein [Thermomonas sp. HDW16]QIL19916.1 TonB family protein [Thermomonas sp. HDW16]
MLIHEREHIARGDLLANACVAVLRCLFWFNPLVHFAARRFCDDQELACDERVIARHPRSRRAYGEAMLKTQIATSVLPLGCHWGQPHPLKERIEMLKQPLPSLLRRMSGRALVFAILLACGYAAWVAQPATSPSENLASQSAVTMSGSQMSMRDVIAKLAREHGMTVSGLALVPAGKSISFGLDGVPLEAVLELLGDEAGLDARVDGKTIEFSRKPGRAMVEPSHMLPPIYPVGVLKQGVSGTVVLVVDVAEDGSVFAAKVDRSAGNESLDAAALDAVKQWKFKPAMQSGKHVVSQVRVPITFNPEDDPDAGQAPPRPGSVKTAGAGHQGSYNRMPHA